VHSRLRGLRLASPCGGWGADTMKVRTCRKCPYTAGDLGSYYDSGAADHCCYQCDIKPVMAPEFPPSTNPKYRQPPWLQAPEK
jgi:hypothetical protein